MSSELLSPDLPEDKAALEHKARMQLLLLSHQYPVLQSETHTTFCTVVKPQPAYVATEGIQVCLYIIYIMPNILTRGIISLYT